MSPPSGYALVTGASSGIGLEVARELARRRYPLVLVARRVDRLEALRVELANMVDVVVIAADLATAAGAQALYDDVRARGLRVDILVNNAGAVGIVGAGRVDKLAHADLLLAAFARIDPALDAVVQPFGIVRQSEVVRSNCLGGLTSAQFPRR